MQIEVLVPALKLIWGGRECRYLKFAVDFAPSACIISQLIVRSRAALLSVICEPQCPSSNNKDV